MLLLQKILAQILLSRPAETLIEASGGAPREVRGMSLDPRFQYIEAQARKKPINWKRATPAQFRARTNAASRLFGGARVGRVRRERVYITGRSHSVPARLYLPQVRENDAAMLVYFHFGGGVIGTLESSERLCGLISRVSGAPVLSVEYRLAPEHKFPAGFEDALAAFHWAVENASRYGGPIGKVAVGGDSQGGAFAAAIDQLTLDRGGPRPVMQLLIYPLLDPMSETASMTEFADAHPLTRELLDFFLAQYLPEEADWSDPRLTPGRRADLTGLAPALIYAAGFDMLLDQGEDYASRLAAAGVPTKLHRFETLPHGFAAFPSASPAAEEALQQIVAEMAVALKAYA